MSGMSTLAEGMTNVDIMNTIRSLSSDTYKDRIPEATQETFKETATSILSYSATKNEFAKALINLIAFIEIKNKSWENPLKELKRGLIPFGKDIEEIFIDVAKAQSYDPSTSYDTWMKQVKPNLHTIFHRLNRQDFYKVSISEQQLQTALYNQDGLSDLVGKSLESLFNGDELDEYLLMKQLLIQYGLSGLYTPIQTEAVTDETTAKSLIKKCRTIAKKWRFYDTQYNAQHVNTHTPIEDIILFMTPEVEAEVDVEALARAFNIDYTDFIGRVILVDDFGELENVQAIMVDRGFFMVYDNLMQMEEARNGEGLYWQYWYHHWQTMSTSQFANAVVFVSDEPTVTGVTVTPATASVTKGAGIQLTAQVTTTGLANEGVTWSIDSESSTITETGYLIVSQNESKSTLTVTATSVFDDSKSGKATITVVTPS